MIPLLEYHGAEGRCIHALTWHAEKEDMADRLVCVLIQTVPVLHLHDGLNRS